MRRPARSSPSKPRPLVGIVVDGVTSYGRAVMRGAMRYANLQRQWLIHEELREVFRPSLVGFPECDGAIVGGASRELFQFVRRHARHVVHCSGSGDPDEAPVVCLDDVAAGRMAAEHLIDCRLEHFGYYGRTWASVSRQRRDGFVAALAERGFACDVSPIDWPEESGLLRQAHWPQLIDWLAALPKPAGILAIDDSASHDLAAACLKANISVPDRVAIVGVNNDDLLCESAWPPLSSVEADYSRMGYLAARMLDDLLRGGRLTAAGRLTRLPPLGVVRRLSTDVLAVDDADVAAAVRYIREHATDPCNVQSVLRRVPVGRRWLERQFAQKLGRTPHDEIMRVRMETAKRLLLQLELSMDDVAERSGFSAVPNFTRAFAQTVGSTPAAYRRAARRGFR